MKQLTRKDILKLAYEGALARWQFANDFKAKTVHPSKLDLLREAEAYHVLQAVHRLVLEEENQNG